MAKKSSLFRTVRTICTVLGVPIGLIGLAGIPGDLQTWGEWVVALQRLLSDHQTIRTVATICAASILLAIWLPWWRLKKLHEWITLSSDEPLRIRAFEIRPVHGEGRFLADDRNDLIAKIAVKKDRKSVCRERV